MLQTFTVEPATLVLIRKLQKIEDFSELRLVGGTALSLYLGHRHSIDIDLFGKHNLEREELIEVIKSIDITVREQYHTKKICGLFCDNVKVDIVNYSFPWINDEFVEDEIRLASKEDIAAMKLFAIIGRGSKKDFIDLYFLLQEYSLSQMLDFFQNKYQDVTLFTVIKSLGYFVDAEKYDMPKMFIDVSWDDVKMKIVKEVKGLD